MWCEFQATDRARIYRCRRCAFTTAPTEFSAERIRRVCRQRDPRRMHERAANAPRGLGDVVAGWIEKISLGRLKGKEGCGCNRRRAWLNRLIPFRRERPPGEWRGGAKGESNVSRMLLRFPHGLGDTIQLTTVLLHLRALRPDWSIDVEARPGAASIFAGLAQRVFVTGRESFRAADYELIHTLAWDEPAECYRDSPSTKAERSLREAFNIRPKLELCRYHVGVSAATRARAAAYLAEVSGVAADEQGRFPVVIVHYQGNSARHRKNLDEQSVRAAIDQILALGYRAVVLDFETPFRSGILREPSSHWSPGDIVCPAATHPLWRGLGTGDGETIAALIAQAALFVGIDSGPAHLAGATDTPSVVVWTRHHPVHYFGLADHVLHLVPADHEQRLYAYADRGRDFFARHYRHRVYRELAVALSRVIEEALLAERATSPSPLIVDGDVWVRAEHRAPDMVIVRDILFDDAYRLGELRLRPRTVLDVGAHVGCFALRAHQRWSGAEIVCVEPNPANLSALHANIGRFARQVPRAATYDPGPVRLVSSIYPGSDNTGASYVLTENDESGSAEQYETSGRIVTVEAVTLETLMEELGWTSIDLLKLDCEGCEFSLLERTESLDKIGAIVGEYHDRARFEALVARRFSSWELRRITDGEPGLFWLINPAAETPRES